MRQPTISDRPAPYAIGFGYGIVAALIGIAQWVLTAHDLAARWAVFQGVQRSVPGFDDATNVARGNELFWFGTAAGAGIVMLVVFLLAALTASGTSQRRRDGVVAAWVAAVLSSVVYLVATRAAIAVSPAPDIMQDILPCYVVFVLLLLGAVIPLAPVGASMGMRAGRFVSRDRHAL